jgi:hypothetical protein
MGEYTYMEQEFHFSFYARLIAKTKLMPHVIQILPVDIKILVHYFV